MHLPVSKRPQLQEQQPVVPWQQQAVPDSCLGYTFKQHCLLLVLAAFAVLCILSLCSIGAVQVHLARLKTGERVVVKVQRPGLKDLFDIDLKNIRWGAGGSAAAVAAATAKARLPEQGSRRQGQQRQQQWQLL